jgi:hypothetical protein
MTKPHNIQVGTVLAHYVRQQTSHWPRVTHKLYQVTRVTATQAVAASGSHEIRLRLRDMKIIGDDYAIAQVADDALLAEHLAQKVAYRRYVTATEATKDLIDKPAHQLKLSLRQLEALAKAWQEIKVLES